MKACFVFRGYIQNLGRSVARYMGDLSKAKFCPMLKWIKTRNLRKCIASCFAIDRDQGNGL
jgi:hypothetical protein